MIPQASEEAASNNPTWNTASERRLNRRPSEDFPAPPPYESRAETVAPTHPPPYDTASLDSQQTSRQPQPTSGYSYVGQPRPSGQVNQYMIPRPFFSGGNASGYRPNPYYSPGAAPRMPQMPGPPGGPFYRPTTWELEQQRFDEEEAAVWYGFGGIRPAMPMPPQFPQTVAVPQWDTMSTPSTWASNPPLRPFLTMPMPMPPPDAYEPAMWQTHTASQQQQAVAGQTTYQYAFQPPVRLIWQRTAPQPPTEQPTAAVTPVQQQQPPEPQRQPPPQTHASEETSAETFEETSVEVLPPPSSRNLVEFTV